MRISTIADMFIPNNNRFMKILELVNQLPNDMELGRAIRKIIVDDNTLIKTKYVQKTTCFEV